MKIYIKYLELIQDLEEYLSGKVLVKRKFLGKRLHARRDFFLPPTHTSCILYKIYTQILPKPSYLSLFEKLRLTHMNVYINTCRQVKTF